MSGTDASESMTDRHVSIVSIQILISDAITELSKLEGMLSNPGDQELCRELGERLELTVRDLGGIELDGPEQ